MKLSIYILVSAILFSSLTLCQEKRGTTTEAEAMVKRAIQYYKSNGREKAFAAISDPKGKFVIKDLYVFVYDMNGKCLAHGGNAKMIGKDLIDLKDADGKLFVQERLALIKKNGKGWQNYKWSNPATGGIENKTAYIEKVDDIIVGCGAYKK